MPRQPERFRGRREEQGFALVSVIGITAIMTIVAGIALTYAMNNQAPSRNHQDWNAALAAAEAGLDDYVSRLNRNASYWATATPDDPLGNDALDATRWAQLPDSEAFYHYTVDHSRAQSEGLIIVQSTGRVRGQTRTIEASYRPEGFLDYVYFTDLETLDPGLDAGCIQEYYFDNPSRGCVRIVFGQNDVIRGPLRTNDRIQTDSRATGPIFEGPVFTWWRGDPDADYWNEIGSSHDPQFLEGIEGPNVTRLELPATNAKIRDETSGTAGGCLYHGPTYIRFLDDGSFRVRSPLTPELPSDQWPNPNCFQGDVSSLASSTGTVVSMDEPFNGVIYVADTSPDYCSPPGNHPLGLPLPNEQYAEREYECHHGDAFVWGTLSGQATVAAENDIKIIWDLVYKDGVQGTDILGLIADQYVKIWHPICRTSGGVCVDPTSPGYPYYPNYPTRTNMRHSGPGQAPYPVGDAPNASPRTWDSPRIDAAILSLNRTFTVQNFHLGARFAPPNAITIRGAIAQRYRGPVALGTVSGYPKDYRFDYRLRYVSPPYFIAPEDSQWVQRTWAELRRPDDLPAW